MGRSKKVRQAVRLARVAAAAGGSGDLERFRELLEALGPERRREVYVGLAEELGLKREAVDDACRQVLEAGSSAEHESAVEALRERLRTPRRRLFESLLALPDGMQLVLRLRAEVLEAQRSGASSLDALERDAAHLLNQWFCQGLLFLREIDESSSYREIRFVKEHELVHPMVSLDEISRRLGRDRRCFGLYHRVLPDAPVLFIEVALTRGIVRSIHQVLDEPPADGGDEQPDTAVFYSINAVEHGLAGLGLGKLLVFQVMEALRASRPGLRSFVTLSPIPGFRTRYLEPILRGEDTPFTMTRKRLLEALSERSRSLVVRAAFERGGARGEEVGMALQRVLADPAWVEDERLARALSRPLREIALYYLTREKDRRGKPANPVAGFHLGNGATVRPSTVNFGANRSPAGVLASCSLMVNYVYSRSWQQQIARTVQRLLPWGRRG